MNTDVIFLVAAAVAVMAGVAWLVYRDRRRSTPANRWPAPAAADKPSPAATIPEPDAPAAPAAPTLTAAELAAQLDELWTTQTPLTELAEACNKPWPTDHAAQLLTAWRNQTA